MQDEQKMRIFHFYKITGKTNNNFIKLIQYKNELVEMTSA